MSKQFAFVIALTWSASPLCLSSAIISSNSGLRIVSPLAPKDICLIDCGKAASRSASTPNCSSVNREAAALIPLSAVGAAKIADIVKGNRNTKRCVQRKHLIHGSPILVGCGNMLTHESSIFPEGLPVYRPNNFPDALNSSRSYS